MERSDQVFNCAVPRDFGSYISHFFVAHAQAFRILILKRTTQGSLNCHGLFGRMEERKTMRELNQSTAGPIRVGCDSYMASNVQAVLFFTSSWSQILICDQTRPLLLVPEWPPPLLQTQPTRKLRILAGFTVASRLLWLTVS